MWIKGFTYGWMAGKGDYRTEKAVQSQDLLYDIGINWMCLAFPVMQRGFSSTEIFFDYRYTVTDKDIIFAVNRAHEHGIKVCLKPVINCADGMWRALIDFPDYDMLGNDRYWKEWFESYGAFLEHYAEIAQDTGCEMFCIGCEMSGTERKEEYWRHLIKNIRKIYTGPLVYNTNHNREGEVVWFDAVDYIGISAYYRIGGEPGASKENMLASWANVREQLKLLSDNLGKQVIFMEIGCRSAKGCAMMPWDFTHSELERSEEEQADFYDTCLTVFHKEPWFAGAFWWDWSTVIYNTVNEAKKDTGFNIHLKKAEDIVKHWYTDIK